MPASGHLCLALCPFNCRVVPGATPWFLPPLTAPPHPKVLDQDTDAIAVHVVRVLTCIMSGSPSAKVRAPAVGAWSGSEIDHVAPELALVVAVRASELGR